LPAVTGSGLVFVIDRSGACTTVVDETHESLLELLSAVLVETCAVFEMMFEA
jgi:hypothetical protein